MPGAASIPCAWGQTGARNLRAGSKPSYGLTGFAHGSSLKLNAVIMTRYLPARHYLWFGVSAAILGGLSGWYATTFPLALIPSGLFLSTAGLLFVMAFRPAVEVYEGYVAIGKRIVPWMDIRRLDRTCWISPLIVRITLFDDSRLLLIYPGDLDACNSLLRHLRRHSRDALIDGIPYRQYWGEVLATASERKTGPAAALSHPAARKTRPRWNASISGSRRSAISIRRIPRTRNSRWFLAPAFRNSSFSWSWPSCVPSRF